MKSDRNSAPKADALPGCATPRAAQVLRFCGFQAQPQMLFRGKVRRNVARTGGSAYRIVPNQPNKEKCDGHELLHAAKWLPPLRAR